jgi:hypothetical protein
VSLEAIMGRDGERILPEEYPVAAWVRLGLRLDAIASEGDAGSEPCS